MKLVTKGIMSFSINANILLAHYIIRLDQSRSFN